MEEEEGGEQDDTRSCKDKLGSLLHDNRFHGCLVALILVDVVVVLVLLFVDLDVIAMVGETEDVRQKNKIKVEHGLHYLGLSFLSIFIIEIILRMIVEVKAFFKEKLYCLIDYFEEDKNKLVTHLCPDLVNNKLIVTDKSESISPVKIKHPSFCPIRNLSPLEDSRLPDDIKHRGIDVGAAVILESADNKILLTRRSNHLRTFPGVWVPPGGHIELNETLIQAGLRELEEETGLHIQPTQCEGQQVHILSLWESVFPTKLSMGQPKRHHLVLYLHAKLTSNLTSEKLDQRMKLNPDEVGASAWLDLPTVEAIVSACEEKAVNSIPGSHIVKEVKGFIINDKNEQEEAVLSTEPLMRVAGDFSDSERVSTGTKFALEEWLACQRH